MIELNLRILLDDAMGLKEGQPVTLREIMSRAGSDLDAHVVRILPSVEDRVQASKEVRRKTGAGLLWAKRALEANAWDPERACEWLQHQGMA